LLPMHFEIRVLVNSGGVRKRLAFPSVLGFGGIVPKRFLQEIAVFRGFRKWVMRFSSGKRDFLGCIVPGGAGKFWILDFGFLKFGGDTLCSRSFYSRRFVTAVAKILLSGLFVVWRVPDLRGACVCYLLFEDVWVVVVTGDWNWQAYIRMIIIASSVPEINRRRFLLKHANLKRLGVVGGAATGTGGKSCCHNGSTGNESAGVVGGSMCRCRSRRPSWRRCGGRWCVDRRTVKHGGKREWRNN
jgi:hypothetical protein